MSKYKTKHDKTKITQGQKSIKESKTKRMQYKVNQSNKNKNNVKQKTKTTQL